MLYDDLALDGAWDLVKGWSAEEREALRNAVPAQALSATIGGRNLREIAKDMLDLASAGLKRRNRLNDSGRDETIYLEPLETILRTGRTAAEDMLEAYATRWQGQVDPIFREYAY